MLASLPTKIIPPLILTRRRSCLEVRHTGPRSKGRAHPPGARCSVPLPAAGAA